MKRILIYTLLLSLFVACKKEDTVWESDWSSPLIDDTLSLANLTNDSTLEENAGFYNLNLSRTLLDLKVSDFVTIPDTTIEEVANLTGGIQLSPGFPFENSVEEHFFNLNEIQLKLILLDEGYIDVRVENPLATTTIFDVSLPGVTKDGVTFSGQYTAPPGSMANPGVSTETIDLSGYTLDLTGVAGGEFNTLRSQITISTDPNGPTVFISPGDQTKVAASFRDIKINYARGYFGNRIVSDTTDLNLDIMNNVVAGSIDIPNTLIAFDIENGIKVTAEGELTTVSNTNNQGVTVPLTGGQMGNSFNVDPASGTWDNLTPSLSTIEFTSANSNIENYVENLGNSHKIGYRFQMNPWGNTSGSYDELFGSSKVSIKMRANMPLSIGIDGLVLRDTFDIQLNQDPEKTRVKSGELILRASNGFPVSGTIKLYLRNQSGNVMHTVIASDELKSGLYGAYDATHGFDVAQSELRFVLPAEVIDDVNDVYSIVVETEFNTVNPATNMNEQMSIPFGAFLAIKLKTKFTTENRF